MWWKKHKKEETEKIIAYLRSRVFPWNFIFEDVAGDALNHYMPYAIQMCDTVGGDISSVSREEVKERIAKEVAEAVNDYLFDSREKGMKKTHGRFATVYPFAFSRCLAYTLLSRLGLEMDEVVDVQAICELLGLDLREIEHREALIRDLISKWGTKPAKILGRSILDRKIMTAEGEYLGNVSDILFTDRTGRIEGLLVSPRKGVELLKSRIPMDDVRVNRYSKNFVLTTSNYAKK